MTYATTHILIAIILIELFRDFIIKDNKKFPRYYILIAAIGGILPDLDYILVYALYPFGFTEAQLHRTFMHSLFIPVTLLLIGIFIYKTGIKNKHFRKRHLTLHTIFFILAATSLIHLILDATILGTIMPLYPITNFSVGLNLLKTLPLELQNTTLLIIDGALLLLWIFWMEFKLKINNYF